MNQARNSEGPYDGEWYPQDQQLPPSLGVWPVGRTYVHPSDGALNTGPAGMPSANGGLDGTPSANGSPGGTPSANGSPGGTPSANGSPGGSGYGGPAPGEAGRLGPYPADGGYQNDDWLADQRFVGSDHIAVPPFTGAPGNSSTPLYERLALYERVTPPPPDATPPRSGRPPLYQVGGRYRGDDWPTDPGFRRGAEPVTPIRPGTAESQASGGQGRETWERNVTPAARVAAVEDAKLLAFLHELIQRLKTIPSLYPRLVFLVVGHAAITSLAAAYAEAIPLPITASLVVIPAAGIIFNAGMRHPDWGRRALVGWIAGVVATIIYDLLRLSLVKVGIWGDPIPSIGRLVFDDPHANFAWGYLWRFAGNGGGMGIAYAMLPWRGVRTGVAYGTLICTGLVALLFFFPVAQVHFFPLTPVTTAGAYAGHWVYGAVLGKITSWWLPPVELGRIHGRLTARLVHPGHRPRPSHLRGAADHAGDPRRASARRSA
jgi:hypothetical protein